MFYGCFFAKVLLILGISIAFVSAEKSLTDMAIRNIVIVILQSLATFMQLNLSD